MQCLFAGFLRSISFTVPADLNPPETMARKRTWIYAGVLLGTTLLAWLGGLISTRVAAGFLAIPEGESVLDVSNATIAERETDGGPPGRRSGPDAEGARPSPGADSLDPSVATEAEGQPRARPKSFWVDPIIKRSIFDSSSVNSPGGGAVGPVGDEQKSDLNVVLLATVVATPAEYSSALIAESKGSKGALGYTIGDSLLGEAEIVRIEQRKVFVRRSSGSIEYIAMDGGTYTKTTAPAGAAAGDEEAGVTATGDNKFTVERSVLDAALANPEKLASQVRVVPHKDASGNVDGYRLSGIRRKSLFYSLGIKNGDVVHTVNGRQLSSMGTAMDAYTDLQNESSFNFEITRRNQRQTFEYEVR